MQRRLAIGLGVALVLASSAAVGSQQWRRADAALTAASLTCSGAGPNAASCSLTFDAVANSSSDDVSRGIYVFVFLVGRGYFSGTPVVTSIINVSTNEAVQCGVVVTGSSTVSGGGALGTFSPGAPAYGLLGSGNPCQKPSTGAPVPNGTPIRVTVREAITLTGPGTISHTITSERSGSIVGTTATGLAGFTGSVSEPPNLDANGDGLITSVDSLCILRYLGNFASTNACPISQASVQAAAAADLLPGPSLRP